MARSHPADLLRLAGEFGPLTVLSIGSQCVQQAEGSPESRKGLIQAISSLQESPANRQLASSIARELALQMDPQELLDRLIEIPDPMGATMIGSAMAILLERTDLAGAKATFQSLPEDLRKAAVDAALEKPGRGISGYLAAIDEVIHGTAWGALKGPLALRLHEAAPQPDQYPALLSWAAQMPEREDTMDLYRVAVRSFVTREPEQARAWIRGMEPGWKQQNSLAAYVQTALAARNDEAGAQWAYDQITDPVFKAEAQDFYRFHEERKRQR